MNLLSEKEYIEHYLRQYMHNLNKKISEERELLSIDSTLTSIRLMQVMSMYNAIEFRMDTILNYYFIKPERSREMNKFLWDQRSMFDIKLEAIKSIRKTLKLHKKIPAWQCFQKCSEIRNIFAHSQYLLDDAQSTPLKIVLVGRHMQARDMEVLYENFIKYAKDANEILDFVSECIGLSRISQSSHSQIVS